MPLIQIRFDFLMHRHLQLHKIEVLQRETILNHGKTKKHIFKCKLKV